MLAVEHDNASHVTKVSSYENYLIIYLVVYMYKQTKTFSSPSADEEDYLEPNILHYRWDYCSPCNNSPAETHYLFLWLRSHWCFVFLLFSFAPVNCCIQRIHGLKCCNCPSWNAKMANLYFLSLLQQVISFVTEVASLVSNLSLQLGLALLQVFFVQFQVTNISFNSQTLRAKLILILSQYENIIYLITCFLHSFISF